MTEHQVFRGHRREHGIPPEVLPRVFDPFFTTRPVGQGLGLGLTVVRNLAEKNGGTLLAESTPGLGSTFTVGLPASGPRLGGSDSEARTGSSS